MPTTSVDTPRRPDTPSRRPGIWTANGTPTDAAHMLSWQPGSLTSFYDYLQPNHVIAYKKDHPHIVVTIRFQHPPNWQSDQLDSAHRLADLVISKWPDIKDIDPYIYFANEVNLLTFPRICGHNKCP